VARKHDPNRLEDLAQAGFTVFVQKGFRRTQVADVALEAGVSTGSLYNYVASKEALFLLVMQRQNQDAPLELPAELPVRAPSEDDFLLEIRRALTRRVNMEALVRAADASSPPEDCRAEFEEVVRSIYQALHRGRGVLMLLESSATDWPELSEQYGGSTARFIKRLKRYLESRAQVGRLNVEPSAHASARLIAETCAWFAMRRPMLARPSGISDALSEQTVVETLCRAYLPSTRRDNAHTGPKPKTTNPDRRTSDV